MLEDALAKRTRVNVPSSLYKNLVRYAAVDPQSVVVHSCVMNAHGLLVVFRDTRVLD